MATDVAFTLAALSLMSTRAPTSLRVFLLTLAIADDVGSVVVLALIGHQRVDVSALVRLLSALGVVAVVILATFARRRRSGPAVFIVLTLVLWWLLAHVGIEPTLAGVVIGVLAPADGRPRAAGLTIERAVSPLSSFVILPLFALVAAGIDLSVKPWLGHGDLIGPLVAARVMGKSLGILGACALCVRLGLGRLPRSVSWRQLGSAAVLCGIGFTVPLLFAEHTFAGEPAQLAATKVALVGASVLCAAVGLLLLNRVLPRRNEEH
jgi:Na+:H+ antiporter, NhaA family